MDQVAKVVIYFVLIQLETIVIRGQQDDTQVIYRELSPLTSSDHFVISLSQAEIFHTSYRKILSHEILKVECNYKTNIKSNVVSPNDTQMFCENKNTSPPPFDLFCIKQSTWAVRTRENFEPSKDEDTVCTMTLRAHGEYFDGSQKSSIYRLILTIRARCTQQRKVYKDLRTLCMPKVKILIPSIRANAIIYSIPLADASKTIKLYLIKFPKTKSQTTLVLRILCDQIAQNEGTQIKVSSKDDLVIDAKCKSGTKEMHIEILGNWSRISISMQQLMYFTLDRFCLRQRCLDQFSFLEYLSSSAEKKEKCLPDDFILRDSFKECLEPAHLTMISSTNVYKYGQAVNFTCLHDKPYRPYKIEWSRIQGNVDDSLGTGSTLSIPGMSYQDNNARYSCRLISCVPKPCKVLQENHIHVRLSDIFIGELSFLLPDEKYRPLYKYKRFLKNSNLKKSIEEEVRTALSNNHSEQSLRNYPSFNITSFRNSSGRLVAVGELNMCKSTPELKMMHYAEWMIQSMAHIMEKFTLSKLQDISLLTTSGCANTTEIIGSRVYSWPYTKEGEVAIISCGYDKSYFARRKCDKMIGSDYAIWYKANVSRCQYYMDDNTMESLSHMEITKDNMLYVSSELLQFLSRPADISSYDISLGTTTLEKFVGLINQSNEVESNILAAIDGIMSVDEHAIKESEEKHNAASRIITLLGDFGGNIASRKPRIINRQNFALGGLKLKISDFTGLNVILKSNDSNTIMEMNSNKRQGNESNVLARIVLPSSIKKSISQAEGDIAIVSVAYDTDDMFVIKDNVTEQRYMINSRIISTEIRGFTITKIDKDPVRLNFTVINASMFNHHKKCVYWNFSKNAWLSDGCSVQGVDEITKTVLCTCDHLTNFALLFNTIPPPLGIHRDVLSYITYIGMGISFVGALLTMLTYVVFPMLRRKLPPKILINLCAAFIMMQIFFLLGDKEMLSDTSCKISSFFLQYFFLSIFCWCAVEGYQSFRGIVRPMSEDVKNFMKKATLFGWGLPLVLTSIGVLISLDDYSGDEWCVVGGRPFFITVLAPIAAIILFNIICLISVIATLLFKTRVTNSKPMDVKVRFRIITGFIILFGITWIFGFFVISNDYIVYQYIFCIFCGLQGLYLFLFYCIRVKNNRWAWCKLLKCQPLSEIQRLHTRKSQISRCNTFDTSSPINSNSLSKSTSLLKFTSLYKKGSNPSIEKSETLTLTKKKKSSSNGEANKVLTSSSTDQLNNNSSSDNI